MATQKTWGAHATAADLKHEKSMQDLDENHVRERKMAKNNKK